MAPRRIITAAVLALVPLASLAVTVPAEAAERWTARSSNDIASSEWVEYGPLPGVEGNVHVGFLQARATKSGGEVFGKVKDYSCDPGEVPGGGGHGEEEEGSCDFHGLRFIDGGTITFTVDKKLNTARLTGTLVVNNHGGTARPPVDMTWTGFGDLSQSSWEESGSEGGTTYLYRYESTRRQATVTGYIGVMGFTDDADDVSSGSIARTKSYERITSR
jgi:hypothetical protein